MAGDTATTNAAFDADLKQRDPRWGVRDVDDIVSEAVPNGFELREAVDMPANNLSLVLIKSVRQTQLEFVITIVASLAIALFEKERLAGRAGFGQLCPAQNDACRRNTIGGKADMTRTCRYVR